MLSEYPPDLPLRGWSEASAADPLSLRPYADLFDQIHIRDQPASARRPDLAALSYLDLTRGRLVSQLRPTLIHEPQHWRCVQVLSLMLLDHFREECEVGSTRVVFTQGDSVYKLAFCEDGAIANRIEVQGVHCGVPIAAASWTVVAGVALLRMERVEVVEVEDRHKIDLEKYPWVPLVDMKQVGWTKTGELVCFDAGQLGEFNRAYSRLSGQR
ncbi:hypothetical protein D2E76_15850 [Mycobacteroides abscessus]|uniref:Uncharacterized protein n=1 Tax=Mycobacteroides abscessus TaxID=36809 RepID=A0ABD7HM37_9MYCO|nr:hypothetical protein D2E76_15850 [Mycobacteroides abscessus]